MTIEYMRKKLVNKIPRGNLVYQIILKFTPSWYNNNQDLYNELFHHLQSSHGEWYLKKVRPPGFRFYSKKRKDEYIKTNRSIHHIFLEDENDLFLLKLSFYDHIDKIFYLQLRDSIDDIKS